MIILLGYDLFLSARGLLNDAIPRRGEVLLRQAHLRFLVTSRSNGTTAISLLSNGQLEKLVSNCRIKVMGSERIVP